MDPNEIKVYLVYILGPFEDDSFEEDIKDMNEASEEDDQMIYLFGYSTSKKMINQFMKFRKDARFYITSIKLSKEEFDKFEGYHRSHIIKDCTIEAPSSMIKYHIPESSYGVCTFEIPLTSMEETQVLCAFEWLDDYLMNTLTESMTKVLSIFFKCANTNTKLALYKSGILGLILYLTWLYTGNVPDKDDSYTMINEVGLLLSYSGETFDFNKLEKRLEKRSK